jgi:hypothetical protein
VRKARSRSSPLLWEFAALVETTLPLYSSELTFSLPRSARIPRWSHLRSLDSSPCYQRNHPHNLRPRILRNSHTSREGSYRFQSRPTGLNPTHNLRWHMWGLQTSPRKRLLQWWIRWTFWLGRRIQRRMHCPRRLYPSSSRQHSSRCCSPRRTSRCRLACCQAKPSQAGFEYPYPRRYLFTFMMIILVTANNFLLRWSNWYRCHPSTSCSRLRSNHRLRIVCLPSEICQRVRCRSHPRPKKR